MSTDDQFIDHLPQPERAVDECGFAEPDAGLALHWTNKCTHLNKNYFRDYTIKLLKQFHPKACPSCKSTDYRTIASRPTEVYCTSCRTHYSLTSGTPLDKYRLPLWTFGYLMKEAMDLHPQPLTIQCIKTKLKVGTKTATLLKRRLQLFTSEVRPAIEKMMVDGIRNEFPERFRLPSADKDITDIVQKKPVIYSDTVALFSASQRANGYRSRYKHNGQTSSIYLSDAVAEKKGKYQVGTLVHTISQKAYLVIFSSIPDQKQKTVMPLLDFLPKNAPHFSDEGFPYLHRINPNYRAINHSARAKNDKRNVWARDRWSHNGVHSQVAEGYQRALKTSMANYCYVRPEYSQLYLDEWSGLRALKLHGIDAVSKAKREVVGVSSTAMTTSTTTTDMGVYYYHPDHLGSSSTVTDKKGNFYEYNEFFPYGEVWLTEKKGEVDLPFKFTAKELDAETGLYYYGARYMDPKLGRFVSVDPPMVSGAYFPVPPVNEEAKKRNGNLPGMGGVFNTVNLNVYQYAGNNPVKYIDQDGRHTFVYLDNSGGIYEGSVPTWNATNGTLKPNMHGTEYNLWEKGNFTANGYNAAVLKPANLQVLAVDAKTGDLILIKVNKVSEAVFDSSDSTSRGRLISGTGQKVSYDDEGNVTLGESFKINDSYILKPGDKPSGNNKNTYKFVVGVTPDGTNNHGPIKQGMIDAGYEVKPATEVKK